MGAPRYCFVVNPTAGEGKARTIWKHLRASLGVDTNFEEVWTRAAGDATLLARDAARIGCARVIAVGGDGTASEVAAGLMGTDSVLAVIPAGTGNDFARGLGLPRQPGAALECALHAKERRIDVGSLETSAGSRIFVNAAGVGFDAVVSERSRASPLRRFGHTVPYVASVLATLWSYRPRPVELELDGRVERHTALFVAVSNGCWWGGGMQIAPRARPDDGLLDVCVAGDVSRLEVLRLLPLVYRGGHVGHPKVRMMRAERLIIRADPPIPAEADGEPFGGTTATFAVIRGGLRCVAGLEVGV